MVERKTKIKLPTGQVVDGFEVPVEESTERWSEYKLEDGSILRVKINIITVTRIPEMWDNQGHPFYSINAAPLMAIVESPERLRKKVQ